MQALARVGLVTSKRIGQWTFYKRDEAISCLVHLADLADFQRFNAVYEKHFPQPRPVRTTVGAALLGGAKVEITAVARQSAHT